MIYDLQKAGLLKRIADGFLDLILLCIAAVGFALALSALLAYDAQLDALDGISSGPQDGQPRAHEPHSAVEADAIRRAELSAQLSSVDRAFEKVPPEYRKGLWDAIVHRRYYPPTAGIKTWKRWRQRLLWWTAFYAGFL